MVKIKVGIVKPVKLYDGFKKVPDYDEKIRKRQEELFNGGEELFTVTLDDTITEVFINQKKDLSLEKDNHAEKGITYHSFVKNYENRKELHIFLENKELSFDLMPEVTLSTTLINNGELIIRPQAYLSSVKVLDSKLIEHKSFDGEGRGDISYHRGIFDGYTGKIGDFVLILSGESSNKYVISFEKD